MAWMAYTYVVRALVVCALLRQQYSVSAAELGSWHVFDGHHYFMSSIQMEYHAADVVCHVFGGHLVAINSADEQRFLHEQNPNDYMYWIGLKRNGNWDKWIWQDGTIPEAVQWDQGYPSRKKLIQDDVPLYPFAVQSNFGPNAWQNGYDFYSLRFVCELDACAGQCTERQICVRKSPVGFECIEDTTTSAMVVTSDVTGARHSAEEETASRPPSDNASHLYMYVLIAMTIALLLVVIIVIICLCRTWPKMSTRYYDVKHRDVENVPLSLASSSTNSETKASELSPNSGFTSSNASKASEFPPDITSHDFEPSTHTSPQPETSMTVMQTAPAYANSCGGGGGGFVPRKSTSCASQMLINNGTGPTSVSQYDHLNQ